MSVSVSCDNEMVIIDKLYFSRLCVCVCVFACADVWGRRKEREIEKESTWLKAQHTFKSKHTSIQCKICIKILTDTHSNTEISPKPMKTITGAGICGSQSWAHRQTDKQFIPHAIHTGRTLFLVAFLIIVFLLSHILTGHQRHLEWRRPTSQRANLVTLPVCWQEDTENILSQGFEWGHVCAWAVRLSSWIRVTLS